MKTTQIYKSWLGMVIGMLALHITTSCDSEMKSGAGSKHTNQLSQNFQVPPDDCRPKVLWE